MSRAVQDYDALVELAELLVVFIFTPIFVRLFFALQSQNTSSGPPGAKVEDAPGSWDRCAATVYKGVLIAGTLILLFTFHFITGGLALATIAILLGWAEPSDLAPLAAIGFPYLTGYVAKTRGVTGVKQILWVTAGLGLAAAYVVLEIFAAASLHRHS